MWAWGVMWVQSVNKNRSALGGCHKESDINDSLPERELVALELGPLLRGEPRHGGDVLDGDEQHVFGGYGALC